MFSAKKEKSKRQDTAGALCLHGICDFCVVKGYQGSYTIEAALILPLVLFCFWLAIQSGIVLQMEVKGRAESYEKKETVDIIAYMYRKEYWEEIVEGFYED